LNLTEEIDNVVQVKLGIIFGKVQENSNLVIIYEYDEKKFHHIKAKDNLYFNSKCYSLFSDKKIYYSGGLDDSEKESNKFNYLSVSNNFNEFEFENFILADLLNKRYSHSMIMFKKLYNVYRRKQYKNMRNL